MNDTYKSLTLIAEYISNLETILSCVDLSTVNYGDDEYYYATLPQTQEELRGWMGEHRTKISRCLTNIEDDLYELPLDDKDKE